MICLFTISSISCSRTESAILHIQSPSVNTDLNTSQKEGSSMDKAR